jgi:hypothetical protein
VSLGITPVMLVYPEATNAFWNLKVSDTILLLMEINDETAANNKIYKKRSTPGLASFPFVRENKCIRGSAKNLFGIV